MTPDELETLLSQLHQTQAELEKSRSHLQQLQGELSHYQGMLAWMETSKFWKVRLKFIKFRQKFKKLAPSKLPHITIDQASSVDSAAFEYVPPKINLCRFVPERISVLLIVEQSIPQCLRYRVQQKIEQLKLLGYQVDWISWHDYKKANFLIHFCHVVVFYRVPAFSEITWTIKYAKSLNKIVFFDIDDLIFDRAAYPAPYEKFKEQISADEYEGLVKGVALYRKALSLCDFAIVSTPALEREIEKVTGKGTSFCHRNALDKTILQFLDSSPAKLNRDYLSIFYGSGTKTHDADFQLVAPALSRLMAKYANVRLTIVGYLKLPKELDAFADRIDRVDLLRDLNVYWEFLSQADINIAPLESGLFNDCKSEIKWLEAAIVGVPSVVSATQTYLEILKDGVDGMIAHTPEEWFDKLDILVGDAEIRENMSSGARHRAMRDYTPKVMASNLKSIIVSGLDKAASAGLITRSQSKQKLLFVNVLYPPQALGGATFLLKNIIDFLQLEYSDRYDISVFTYDINNSSGYEISEYNQDGVHVTKMSVPSYPDIDWRYEDRMVYDAFRRYLKFSGPDLIHFHCIQRLTASILEASVHLNIPYFVTVHDAWWICDHQFMMDQNGVELDYRQNDPLVRARNADDINSSMQRRRYLTKYLNKAKSILAVSEFQAAQYRLNGFTQTTVNRNGVKLQHVLPRKPSLNKKVRLGYAGGVCVHKGYYFLKKAITTAQLVNCEVVIIDIVVSEGAIRHENWGGTNVSFIPKVPAEKMAGFFSNIDVLVAPSLCAESFGLISREATLAGVWVVASDKGGLAEDITPGVNGSIFSPNEIDNLVVILNQVDREPDKYTQQLTASCHQIRQIDEQVRELEGLYRSVLSPRI